MRLDIDANERRAPRARARSPTKAGQDRVGLVHLLGETETLKRQLEDYTLMFGERETGGKAKAG